MGVPVRDRVHERQNRVHMRGEDVPLGEEPALATRRRMHTNRDSLRARRASTMGAYAAYPCRFRSTFQVLAPLTFPAPLPFWWRWAGTRSGPAAADTAPRNED